MMEVMKFVFQDFWHCFGTFLIVVGVSNAVFGAFKRSDTYITYAMQEKDKEE